MLYLRHRADADEIAKINQWETELQWTCFACDGLTPDTLSYQYNILELIPLIPKLKCIKSHGDQERMLDYGKELAKVYLEMSALKNLLCDVRPPKFPFSAPSKCPTDIKNCLSDECQQEVEDWRRTVYIQFCTKQVKKD